jgi:hypothetical protein
MQTNPEQWALDLLADIIDIGGLGGPCLETDCVECGRVALKIQAAFAEREARLVGAITSTNAMACTPDGDGSHKITLHYPDTATAMAAFVQLSDVADGGMKDRTHG